MKTLPLFPPKPKLVLMILTHPFRGMKNLLITLRCLERYTDLNSFKKIYILANASFGEHSLLIQKYVKKYPDLIQDMHCSPPGHAPCVAHMQNVIHETHYNDIILKMDDDMFVTPGWLPPLQDAWCQHNDDPFLGIVAPLVPINTMGAKILLNFMSDTYGDAFRDIWIRGGHISSNIRYHAFVWEKVLRDNLIPRFQEALETPLHITTGNGSHISINCILYDKRMIEYVYPYPLQDEWFEDGEKKFDESMMDRTLLAEKLKAIVVKKSTVHHYSFNPIQDELSRSIPLDTVYDYLMRLGTPSFLDRKCETL